MDRGGRQAALDPAPDHHFDMPPTQLPRVDFEPRLAAQLGEEAEVKAAAVRHGLERYTLVLCAVLGVVQLQQRANHGLPVVRAVGQRRQDVVGRGGYAPSKLAPLAKGLVGGVFLLDSHRHTGSPFRGSRLSQGGPLVAQVGGHVMRHGTWSAEVERSRGDRPPASRRASC